jgi:uncharacterized membrane protein
MSKYDWLLFFHVTGAFLLVGGAVIAAVLNIGALRSERPSEIAMLLGLIRIAVAAIGLGVLLTLVFGLWLVDVAEYSYGSFWVIAALVLWVASNVLGWRGGEHDKQTRELAERLAAEGDRPSPALQSRLRAPASLLGSYGSGVLVLLIVVDMIWKPGA